MLGSEQSAVREFFGGKAGPVFACYGIMPGNRAFESMLTPHAPRRRPRYRVCLCLLLSCTCPRHRHGV